MEGQDNQPAQLMEDLNQFSADLHEFAEEIDTVNAELLGK